MPECRECAGNVPGMCRECAGDVPECREYLEKTLAITFGMLRRALKTLRRRTGPISSSKGTAEEPKGTKKPALSPGTMRHHVSWRNFQ